MPFPAESSYSTRKTADKGPEPEKYQDTGDFFSALLGLYIVKNIVDANGGRLEIQSEIGKGTTVRVVHALSYG
jgi:K+-sensing histidine kinase KdpD